MKGTTANSSLFSRGIFELLVPMAAGALVIILSFKVSLLLAVAGAASLLVLLLVVRRPQYGLYLAAATVTLGNYSFASFLSGTLTATRLFALLALLSFLVGQIARGRVPEIPKNTKTFLLSILSLSVLVSALIGIDHKEAVTGLFYYYVSFLTFLSVILIVRDEDSFRKLIATFLLSLSFFALWGIVSYLLGLDFAAQFSVLESRRMTSTQYLGPNAFALMLVAIYPFAFNFYIHEEQWKKRMCYLLWAGLLIGGTLLTYSRASTVTLGLVTLYIIMRSWKRLTRGEVVGFAAAVLLVLFMLPGLVFERVESLSRGEDDPSLKSRWSYILVGYEIFKDHPLFGVGPNNYKVAYASPEYKRYGYLSESNIEMGRERGRQGRAAHNMYIEVLTEVGVVGLGLLGCLLFLCWRELRASAKRLEAGREGDLFLWVRSLEIGFLAFLLNSAFLSSEFFPILWIMVGLASVTVRLAEAGR